MSTQQSAVERVGDELSTAVRSGLLHRPVEALGFWAGVTLPFLYLPLVLSGLESQASQVACVVLLVVHAAALYVGRGYKQRVAQ
ncbi:hypothetical protein [Halocalculus aciditolerans]|uniref:Uncharacterized protein n=1 Tax=Halocalculus aciditolerans TaxID=1383812 RepID=A0A830F932_9EURY|nr:hypothetical protein [Halocalculus aciditolerans]GGL51701.1 hypothetical protein GCM10009039_07510 [Halocalculus aciditolerans]